MTFQTRWAAALSAACMSIFQVLFVSTATAETRTYFVAASEVEWDYAPSDRGLMVTGEPFNEMQQVFATRSAQRIGDTYHKALYFEYTDDSYTARVPHADPSCGMVGPVIHAEVGDTIQIVFKNLTSLEVSIHPDGVFHTKANEGVPTNDGTSGDDLLDDRGTPCESYTYVWDVPERAGPGPADPSSIVSLYHSHVHAKADINTGLVGAMVITRAGMADADGKPKDIDHEFFNLFQVVNENESHVIGDMVAQLDEHPQDADASEESNLMHMINGYVYGNMPMPEMKVGERVRWYLGALGSEVDLHTPHWHGNTALVGGMRKDVVELLPATTLVADMVPDSAGIWLYHCHVHDHIHAGMTARYQVLPADEHHAAN